MNADSRQRWDMADQAPEVGPSRAPARVRGETATLSGVTAGAEECAVRSMPSLPLARPTSPGRQSCSSRSASGGRLCSTSSTGPASRGGGAEALT